MLEMPVINVVLQVMRNSPGTVQNLSTSKFDVLLGNDVGGIKFESPLRIENKKQMYGAGKNIEVSPACYS